MKKPTFKNIKYPTTLEEWYKTKEGEAYLKRIVQREVQFAIGLFNFNRVFYFSEQLKILCNFTFGE